MHKNNPVLVVCAILYKDGNVLIAKRQSKVANAVWEFPGGKVEPMETKEDACIREIKEELGLDIEIDGFVCDILDDTFNPPVHVYAYQAHIIHGDISLHAHSTYEWIAPSLVFNYTFQKADLPILQAIQKETDVIK